MVAHGAAKDCRFLRVFVVTLEDLLPQRHGRGVIAGLHRVD
jgi:hypothetical protein